MNRRLLNYTPDMEFLEHAEAHATSAPADPHAAMALSAGLLEVADQAELKVFLTDLVASVAATGRSRIGAPLRQALVDALHRVARPIVPIHSNGDSELRFGSNAASAASADLNPRAAHLFGMELEGLSPEDKEYEVAQQFIRLAADTIGHAGAARSGRAPQAVAGAALQQAARRYAPGLLQAAPPARSQTQIQTQTQTQTGRWRREGRRIVVFNC